MFKDGRFKKYAVLAAVIVFITAAVLCFSCCSVSAPRLVVYDGENGEIYAQYDIYDGMEFSVEFIHSVNKSPVIDVFVIKNGEIYADRTIYCAFGAGVQTELEGDETLTFDEEGRMVVSGFNIKFPQVKYIVGTVSDHILFIEEEYISLTELCGKNAHIVFEIKK